MAPHDLPKQQLPGGVVGIDAAQIKIEAGQTYHYLYSAVHRAHKEAPDVWTIQECTRIMTSIMAAKSFSWRVVGITEAALKKFSEFNFRYKSGAGITRAHLKPRIETVRTLLAPSEPLSEVEFLNIWLQNDRTVLCVSGENKTTVPKFIALENPDGELFSCHRVLAGWRHRRREQDHLRNLFDRGPRG